jgi:predicted Rossmann-fold nucleotide-binding protein
MQAANEGAASTPERARSVGIRIDLPFEQDVNAFVTDAFTHRTFFTRLHQFVLSSDAFIVAPGGIGTVLEMTMIWQLAQVGHLQNTPLILVGDMWPGLVEWARREMLRTEPPLANAEDMAIPRCVPNADAAIEVIRRYREQWLARGKKPA